MITLQEELRIVELPDGTIAAVLDVVAPDCAPPIVREGFARRRIVNSGGTCPCGARLTLPPGVTRRSARGSQVTVEHDTTCPADTATLTAALRNA